jgi:thiol-disulfide isomerase/thioredoxin
MAQTIGHRISLPSEGRFPSLGGANGWLNSPPLTADGVRGKVVVVNFCTYTRINWFRSLPYVRAWSEAYRDHGLVVLGVHTPEFSFEHDLENVRQALHEMRVEYPVAIDNATRSGRRSRTIIGRRSTSSTPKDFIDAEGRIRHHRFGEGERRRPRRHRVEAARSVFLGAAQIPSIVASGFFERAHRSPLESRTKLERGPYPRQHRPDFAAADS